MKRYVKWFASAKMAWYTAGRLSRKYPGKIMVKRGNSAGYKTGYVVVSAVKIRGWKLKNIR